MRILMRSSAAVRLAKEYYTPSEPLSHEVKSDRPLELGWWLSHPQTEQLNRGRHLAGLNLYLEIARSSKHQLDDFRFPALFEFEDRVAMRPDKGVIKVLLDGGAVTDGYLGAQLVFDLTPSGRQYLQAGKT